MYNSVCKHEFSTNPNEERKKKKKKKTTHTHTQIESKNVAIVMTDSTVIFVHDYSALFNSYTDRS